MSAEEQIHQLSRNLDEALRTNQRQLMRTLEEVQTKLRNMEAQLHRIEAQRR